MARSQTAAAPTNSTGRPFDATTCGTPPAGGVRTGQLPTMPVAATAGAFKRAEKDQIGSVFLMKWNIIIVPIIIRNIIIIVIY